jgi:hypothetical protein
MNTKSITLIGALTLGFAGLAGAAPQYVYLTGSTAARGSVYNALAGTVPPNSAVFDDAGGPAIITQGNTTASKADYMNFTGHMRGTAVGVVTSVKCHWSGSEAGIADAAGITQEQFLTDTAPNSSTDDGPFTVATPVDLAMADNDKAFSKNPNATFKANAFVGIIPFQFVAEKGSNPRILNVTDAQIRTLMGQTAGHPDALFTGSAADYAVDHYVYLTGRNSNSGTRVNSYGISRYGIFSTAHQVQCHDDGTGKGVMTDQGGALFPSSYVGDYGYESGGDVAKQMGLDLSTSSDPGAPGTPFSVIAYLGTGDAATAVGKGAVALTYNGVAFTTAAVQQGNYGFWGNEQLYESNTASVQAQTCYGLLSPAVTGINHFADGTKLIDLSTMVATRNGPTSDPIHNP